MSPFDQSLLVLEAEVARFLSYEALLLDERRFDEWLACFSKEAKYAVPIRQSRKYGEWEHEVLDDELDVMWLADDYRTLEQRVQQISTGVHWAEEPVTRVTRLVTNVLVLEAAPSPAEATTVRVSSKFLSYRNRVEDETSILVGRRTDTLRREGSSFLIVRRDVLLDQNVLLVKNLAVLI